MENIFKLSVMSREYPSHERAFLLTARVSVFACIPKRFCTLLCSCGDVFSLEKKNGTIPMCPRRCPVTTATQIVRDPRGSAAIQKQAWESVRTDTPTGVLLNQARLNCTVV